MNLTFISSTLANEASWKTKTTLSFDHLLILTRIDIGNKLNLEQTKQTYPNNRKANWNRFTEDIELALHSVPDIHDFRIGNKDITDLILLADKHHVPKGLTKNLIAAPSATHQRKN